MIILSYLSNLFGTENEKSIYKWKEQIAVKKYNLVVFMSLWKYLKS